MCNCAILKQLIALFEGADKVELSSDVKDRSSTGPLNTQSNYSPDLSPSREH